MFNRFKRAIPLLIMGIAIATVSAFSASSLATYQSVAKLGPYWTSSLSYDTAAGGQAGGLVHLYKSGTGTGETLFVGDVVYLSANNTVLKSTTLANYNTIAGVVVGGTRTNMRAVTSSPGATDTAAFVNQTVIVLSQGRTWVKIDAAAGIAPGLLLSPSTTVAGKVKALPTSIDTLYRAVGRLVDTGVVSTSVLANIRIK